MNDDLVVAVAGTVVLWAVSAGLALLLGFVFLWGSLSHRRLMRAAARSAVNLTRGIPTSLLVLGAGITALHLPAGIRPPSVFPGTLSGFQHVAWAVVFALALGSAGHFAEILRASRAALGNACLDQTLVMGLPGVGRFTLLVREAAVVALPPVGARLTHHLHNTGFAALFPVTDLLGFVQSQADRTFRVLDFMLLGTALYVALSALIWLSVRALEAHLVHGVRRVSRPETEMAW